MLQISLDSEGGEVEICGSESDLMELRDALLIAGQSSGLPSLLRTEANFDPSPYPHKLIDISIQVTNGSNLIGENDGKLSIAGSSSFFTILAQNVEYFENSLELESGHHIHYDTIWPDTPLADTSLDLILVLRK